MQSHGEGSGLPLALPEGVRGQLPDGLADLFQPFERARRGAALRTAHGGGGRRGGFRLEPLRKPRRLPIGHVARVNVADAGLPGDIVSPSERLRRRRAPFRRLPAGDRR